ncbi:DNA-directed RNA polymerase subunit A'' [Candidatus Woesearchaeota archaeon]|nr:DNA-directed RNA polymerase subunit A'' [Candidatus Woesearchaeota archaeon]
MTDIFEKYKDKLPGAILEEIKLESKSNELTQAEIIRALDESVKEYEAALIAPGEAIGIITAESFGEAGTQMTLNVFHFAGVAEIQVTRGLPRLIELFDARKEPSTPSMEVYLKPEFTANEKTIRRVASFIKEMKLQEISSEISLNIMKQSVDIDFNEEKIKLYGFKKEEIIEKVTKDLKNVTVKETKKGITITSNSEEVNLSMLYKIKENAKSVLIRGISKITQVLPKKEDSKYVILCAGSNLKEVLNMKEVESKLTTTNNIFEISSSLGIEAARQAIINEALSVIENQGLDINIRHVMFLADIMTQTGVVRGITRGGISGEKESVLARASFETPINHLIDASLTGELDNLKSVIENVIINQPIPLGTGLPGLMSKMKKEDKKGAKK